MDWILPFRFVQNPDKSSMSIFKVAQTHAPLHSCILKNPCDERPIARARSHIRNKADVWKRKPPSPSRLRNCKAAWQHSSYCKFDHLSNHWFCGRAGLAIAILALKTLEPGGREFDPGMGWCPSRFRRSGRSGLAGVISQRTWLFYNDLFSFFYNKKQKKKNKNRRTRRSTT